MAVLGKALGQGYPMSAVIGTEPIMSAAQESFISSTYWTERIGPTAALAFLEKYERENVASHLMQTGTAVQTLWREAAARSGVEIQVSGIPPLAHFDFNHPDSQALGTLFCQEMLARGILAGRSFYAPFCHQAEHLKQYETALNEVFRVIAEAIANHTIEDKLEGPIAHSGFKRLT